MSHELRTPLNAIIGYTDLLLMGISGEIPAPAQEQLNRIHSSARHLLELIEQILLFSRAAGAREVVRLEQAYAAEIARSAAHQLEPAAADKGLDLRVRVPDRPISLRTDAGKVRQILLNLLSNAVKFTERGFVEIELVEPVDDELRFHVRDTGPGMRPAQIDRIFKAFWQAEQTATRQFGGTGLGLTIARRLAQTLGGELSAASTVGQGCEFTLKLSLSAAPPTDVAGSGGEG